MSELQRIDDMQAPPVIGQLYLVRCVRVAGPVGSRKRLRDGVGTKGCEGMLPGWWPVIGPEHEDAALFDFPHQHWHFDLRFLSTKQLENRMRRPFGGSMHDVAEMLSFPLTNHGDLSAPEYRKRRCFREQPDWSAWLTATRPRRPDKMAKLERVTLAGGQTLKACRVCPHRGLHLGSMPVVDGIITCPGHGLRWHASTGELVRTRGPVRAHALAPVSYSQFGDNVACSDIARAARRGGRAP